MQVSQVRSRQLRPRPALLEDHDLGIVGEVAICGFLAMVAVPALSLAGIAA